MEQEVGLEHAKHEIISFSIERGIDDIPGPEPCACCGGDMEKCISSYGLYATNSVVRTDEAPGYQCLSEKCGTVLFDPMTTIELTTTAASFLTAPEDLSQRARLYAEAAQICERLAEKDVDRV